jgi:hypothetical protein
MFIQHDILYIVRFIIGIATPVITTRLLALFIATRQPHRYISHALLLRHIVRAYGTLPSFTITAFTPSFTVIIHHCHASVIITPFANIVYYLPRRIIVLHIEHLTYVTPLFSPPT